MTVRCCKYGGTWREQALALTERTGDNARIEIPTAETALPLLIANDLTDEAASLGIALLRRRIVHLTVWEHL